MNATLRTILATLCIAIITLCGALLFGRAVGNTRVADLTEQNLYSLSDGTQRILDDLGQDVTLKLYYSRKAARGGPESIRFWNNYFLYVRDLLGEYVSRSAGRVRLEVIDPRPFSEAEDQALAHGVKRFAMPGGDGFFFGLVATNDFGKTRTIELFEPNRQEFVEYDVSKLISQLSQRDKKAVGVLSSLPVQGDDMSPYMMQMLMAQGKRPARPWTIIEHLRQTYDVRAVQVVDGAIDQPVDYLLVIHPKKLDAPARFAIDQFVMGGGKLLVFIDPHCRVDRPAQGANPYAPVEASSELNDLLAGWGVKMQPTGVAVDRALAMQVQTRPGGAPVPFLPFLGINEKCVNGDEVVAAELHSMTMLFAGVLEETESASTTVRPLLQTTAIGGVWAPMSPMELQNPNPEQIARTVPDGSSPVMLACMIEGEFKTNFPDGIDIAAPAPGDSEATTQPATQPARHIDAVAGSADGAAVIVVADVDMISDPVAYQDSFFGRAQANDNASFVFNAIDYLGGESDLIAIRTRGSYSRPFEVIDEIERQAEQATAEEVAELEKAIQAKTAKLQSLGRGDDGETGRLLDNKILAQRREIEADIRNANKQLRSLQAQRREKVETIQWRLQLWNLVAAPAMILGTAIVLWVCRRQSQRRYARRRVA